MISDSEMIGKRYGRLTVVKRSHQDKDYRWHWQCRCDCGNMTTAPKSFLDRGNKKSCGCLSSPPGKPYRWDKMKEYRSWSNMKTRCFNQKSKDYSRYGSRGITVCKEWTESFEAFYTDMGPAPSSGHQIDRVDTNDGYHKQNCRWATSKENNCNRRDSKIWHVKGCAFDSAPDAAKHFNVSFSTIHRWCKGRPGKNTTAKRHDCNCVERYTKC